MRTNIVLDDALVGEAFSLFGNKTAESDVKSRDLKRLGLEFDGSSICYAFVAGDSDVNEGSLL